MTFNKDDLELIQTTVSILTFLTVIISLSLALRQLKLQSIISRNDSSLAAFLKFNEEYRKIAALRRNLSSRFEAKDTSLNRDDVMIYYNMYWHQRQEVWEYFTLGLLPISKFIDWMDNSMGHINNERNLYYYDGNEVKCLYSREIFIEYALNRIYLRDQPCREFFQGLLNLSYDFEKKGLPFRSDKAFECVTAYIARVARKIKWRKNWRIKGSW